MSMLEKYFKHYLKSKGFEDVDKVLYSLSYCQGDGCSFTTQLGVNDIRRLIPFLYPAEATNAPMRIKNLISGRESRKFIQDSDEDSVVINITQDSNHYCHQNTMSFDWEGNIHEDRYNEMSEERDLAFEEFGNALIEDIFEYAKDCARELESKGYSLIEAFNYEDNQDVWSFRTKHYMIKLAELSDTCEYALSDFDDDCFIDVCESMIEGKTIVRNIQAQVFDLRDDPDCDDPIAEDSLWSITCDTDDRTYGGYRREVIGNAIAIVKHHLQDDRLANAA